MNTPTEIKEIIENLDNGCIDLEDALFEAMGLDGIPMDVAEDCQFVIALLREIAKGAEI